MLIVGPTNSGKMQFHVNKLCGLLCGTSGHWHNDWIGKKVMKENFINDPSSNIMKTYYVKFSAVMAGSLVLKNYHKHWCISRTFSWELKFWKKNLERN